MPQHTLVGISGSLRHDSTNTKLVREAARVFDPATFIEADIRFPLFDADMQERDGVPDAVMTLAQQIKDADAVVISTPEYNKGISGSLKNALDWLSRTGVAPWTDKPVAILSAAAGRAGGERTQMMLRYCMVAFRPRILQGPEVFIADSSNQFDENGRLTNEFGATLLAELMDGLKREVARG